MIPLSESQWKFLFTVGERLVPPLGGLDGAGRQRFQAIVAAALSERPAAVQRQLRLFLSLLRLAPVLRWGAPFQRISASRQDRLLRWLQDKAPSRLQQGFWALKTLVFMGYYGQAELAPRLGYTPSPMGNQKLYG